jgi:hypothetical protein
VHKKDWGGRLMPLAARPNLFYSASPGLTTIAPQTTLVQHGEQNRPELHGGQDRPGLRLAVPGTASLGPHRLRGKNYFAEGFNRKLVDAVPTKQVLQSH